MGAFAPYYVRSGVAVGDEAGRRPGGPRGRRNSVLALASAAAAAAAASGTFPFSFSLATIPFAAAAAPAVPVGCAAGTRATTLSTSAPHIFLFFRAEKAFAQIIRAWVERACLAAGCASAAHL